MIRFIILAVVIYIFYRALKSWMFPKLDTSKSVTDKKMGEIDDVMIKDPQCKAYFPKRNAVHSNIDGEDLYFCSAKCKAQYTTEHSGKKSKKSN